MILPVLNDHLEIKYIIMLLAIYDSRYRFSCASIEQRKTVAQNIQTNSQRNNCTCFVSISVEIKAIRSVPALFESKLPLLDERASTTGKSWIYNDLLYR